MKIPKWTKKSNFAIFGDLYFVFNSCIKLLPLSETGIPVILKIRVKKLKPPLRLECLSSCYVSTKCFRVLYYIIVLDSYPHLLAHLTLIVTNNKVACFGL